MQIHKRRTVVTWQHMSKLMVLLVLLVGLIGMLPPVQAKAAEADIQAKIAELKVKFPEGKYWNHVGSSSNNEDGWTNSPCTCHGVPGVSHVYGTNGCTCNHHQDAGHLLATQCMGFANKLGYDIFGNTTWTVYTSPSKTQLANVKVGDIIRYSSSDTSGHSVFVIAKNGYKVTIGEANYSGKCQISWTRVLDLSSSSISVSSYQHAANYDSVVANTTTTTENATTAGSTSAAGSTENTAEATTEVATTQEYVPFTGWKQAEDGIHYQYIKNDVVLKKKWLTLNGKKYYLNKNGYRLTGICKVGKQHYYFNDKGVMQKTQWITVNNEDYYVNYKGYVLKSQWLWHGTTLVYATADGSVAKSELVKIGSSTYYFNADGKRSKGFKKVDGKYYYCNSNGVIQKKKWIQKGKKTYYVQKTGVRVQSKLFKIGKYRYYFNNKGVLLTKQSVTYKGKTYTADRQGRCKLIQTVTTEATTTQAETTETITTEVTTEQTEN